MIGLPGNDWKTSHAEDRQVFGKFGNERVSKKNRTMVRQSLEKPENADWYFVTCGCVHWQRQFTHVESWWAAKGGGLHVWKVELPATQKISTTHTCFELRKWKEALLNKISRAILERCENCCTGDANHFCSCSTAVPQPALYLYRYRGAPVVPGVTSMQDQLYSSSIW